jgi:hypothetical protein
MAIKKFICPPTPASGSGTFSDNLVGFQLVQGGGLTQGNFQFTNAITEKTNRTFYTGVFSDPINLENMGISNVEQSKLIFENNFKVYPNFDITQINNFVQYGSMTKRISTSITKIISYFPAALESHKIGLNYKTGSTAFNITYNPIQDTTSFTLDVSKLRNPFDIDFTINSTRNLSLRDIEVSVLRNLTVEYAKYSLYYREEGYSLVSITPTTSLTTGYLTITVNGNPFSGENVVYDTIVVRPNDYEVNKVYNEDFDEVENFLLNRNQTPKYTCSFRSPKEADDGTFYITTVSSTWPTNGNWNLDISTANFNNYLTQLDEISQNFDSFKSNLISRFLTTGAFKDFDTVGQKMEKVLQVYGRSFDETNKFINALAFMNSVNYTVKNDIPSQLLKNLAQTLGWRINISPISNEDFLSSVFGQKNSGPSEFSGVPIKSTPDELNYQFYRNLVLNSAYLFKSKGTRKSIENLMKLIGAPDALVEFNEYVYVVDQKINLSQFDNQFLQISAGTYVSESAVLDPTNIFSIFGDTYTGYTTSLQIKDVNIVREEFPMDDEGYPSTPENTENFYFQIGSGWFESTPQHRAPEQVDLTNSVFTGTNPNYQTQLQPFTYGQIYLNRFQNFPFMNLGYELRPVIDNNKSWTDSEVGQRVNLDGSYNARYVTEDDRLVLNVKNIDVFLNPGQALLYDVWYMSRQYNYPIPNQGLFYQRPTRCNPTPNIEYPYRGGVDWTEINPQPKRKSFFEFAQTFWHNTINVRNRQFQSDGKTSGYPTLQSIFWKYLNSNKTTDTSRSNGQSCSQVYNDIDNGIGVANNNFNYYNMIEYVNGLGDYWIRLVEQMVPATTIWNTGVRYENSIFHRQKFVWRRQAGCNLVPQRCNPCSTTASIFPFDCASFSTTCPIYPWDRQITDFGGVLGNVLTNYLSNNNLQLTDCQLNTLTTNWVVEILIDNQFQSYQEFFTGFGYGTSLSYPSESQWLNALIQGLDSLENLGYSYYLTTDNNVVVYNSNCSFNGPESNLKINVGISFNIICS